MRSPICFEKPGRRWTASDVEGATRFLMAFLPVMLGLATKSVPEDPAPLVVDSVTNTLMRPRLSAFEPSRESFMGFAFRLLREDLSEYRNATTALRLSVSTKGHVMIGAGELVPAGVFESLPAPQRRIITWLALGKPMDVLDRLLKAGEAEVENATLALHAGLRNASPLPPHRPIEQSDLAVAPDLIFGRQLQVVTLAGARHSTCEIAGILTLNEGIVRELLLQAVIRIQERPGVA